MMMRVGLGASVAATVAAAAAGQPALQQGSPNGAASAQACSARKFETIVRFTGANGKARQSKVRLCGTPGQTDAEWAATLRDGAQKFRANEAMPPQARQQVVAAIEAELAKVAVAAAPATVLVNAPPLPAPRSALPSRSALPEYSALPPFPPPAAPAPAIAPASGGAAAKAGAAIAKAPSLAPLPAPRLSLSCFSAGDIGDGPCFGFERDTMITVRAGEPLQNTALRFVRGSVEADHPLPALAKGRSARFVLPRAVCAGAVGGSLTIRIVRAPAGQPAAAQVVASEGPYNLRC